MSTFAARLLPIPASMHRGFKPRDLKPIELKPIELKLCTIVCTAILTAGCSMVQPNVEAIQQGIEAPASWQAKNAVSAGTEIASTNGWITHFDNPQLNQLVTTALNNNAQLQQQTYDVAIKEKQLGVSASALWPNADVTLAQSKSKASENSGTANAASLELGIHYELDIWGKLSAAKQQAHQEWLAAKSLYQYQKHTLAANVAIAWIETLQAHKILQILENRVANANDNREIIEAGYRRGVYSSLDVYLVRNELNSERANIAAQKTLLTQSLSSLERLLGTYPSGTLSALPQIAQTELPPLPPDIDVGMPQDVIERHPNLAAQWSTLLSRNAALAFAHRRRLPSINLSGAVSDKATLINKLLSGTPSIWSLAAGLSAPVFNAGRLKREADIAHLQLKQTESAYLDEVYNTYAAVENALTQERNLKNQFQALKIAEENAELSATLSFEQYQKGLVSYTTVLDAQARFYNAQSATVNTQSALLTNRIALHLALGGEP